MDELVEVGVGLKVAVGVDHVPVGVSDSEGVCVNVRVSVPVGVYV
jgi:hypothetical protein